MRSTNVCFWSLVLYATACRLPVSGAEPLAATNLPLIAYIHGGKLYFLRAQDRYGVADRKPMELWQGRLTREGSWKKQKQLIHVAVAYEHLPDRWRVSHGCFWWLEDHARYDAGSGDMQELMRIPLDKVSTPIDDQFRWSLLAQEWTMTLGPPQLLREGLSPSDRKKIYFDVIPANKDEFSFLVAWHGELRIWHGVVYWKDRDDDPRLKGMKDIPKRFPDIKWDHGLRQPNMNVRTDLREPFFGYEDKTHLFCLTVSGKLYSCRKRGENQRTELLWNEAHSPIRVVIHDTASKKTFAFTKAIPPTDKDGRHVFFALAPKVELTAYDPKTIPEFKPDDPLVTMMEYARILVKEKQIKSEDSERKGGRTERQDGE